MARIILNISDDKKASTLLSVLQELPFVEARMEDREKVWTGQLETLKHPIHIENFKTFSKEQLNER